MPINVFGNSSNNINNKIDTSLFVQKPYLRTNYIESNIEEDIDLKNQYRVKNLQDLVDINDACNKNYADNLFSDPSIVKNNAHIDLNDRNITNCRFLSVNQLPQIDSHLTAKLYVDNSIDESSVVRNIKDNNFNNYKLTNISSITLNTQAVNDNEVITKAYVDQFHQESERSRRDLGIDFYNESSTILRFNQTLQNYLKVSVGNDTYNLTKYDKIQITDTTEIKYPNIRSDLLQKWYIKCNNKNDVSKVGDFIKSTKTNPPTPDTGATSLPPIGNSFMYIETSSNNYGHERVFVSWERINIIQITNITFYYNRFSILNNEDKKSMGRFKIQLLLENNSWSTQYTIDKNTQYSNTSTEWKLLNLNFTIENYGIKLIYDQIDTPHADMCFSNITITHSVY